MSPTGTVMTRIIRTAFFFTTSEIRFLSYYIVCLFVFFVLMLLPLVTRKAPLGPDPASMETPGKPSVRAGSDA